jgi:hypothetical protein
MDLSHNTEQFLQATRRDGWTPALKARFLSLLAENGNARLAARRCGLSVQSAYVQRRRDAVFARGWAAALVHAHDYGEQVLADRALEGVEEQIYYRGELVGARRRYDSRLLLAHLARLDRCLADHVARRDAERFDELVALVAGAEPPEALAQGPDVLPDDRAAHAEAVAEQAEEAMEQDQPRGRGAIVEPEHEAAVAAAGEAAYEAAAAEWDGWFDHACAVVDGLESAPPPEPPCPDSAGPNPGPSGEDSSPLDPVNRSTSPAPAVERLTFGGFVFNRPADRQPREIEAADHPSETVGAGPGGPA